ncbi:MAG: TRAP transporter TatT component family protein [Acidobacteriota bacterium]
MCVQSCSRTAAVEPPPAAASPETIAAAVTESDKLFRKREDVANLKTAIALLSKLRVQDHRVFDVEWRYAKLNYFLGCGVADEKEKQAAFEKGRDAGKIASNMEPQKPDGYFWFGANLGEIAKMNPVTVGLNSIDDIKASMNKVIELDPTYQNTAAYDVLAQVELNTLMFGGNSSKAAELLEKAMTIETDNAQVRLHLGQAYLAQKKEKEAKAQFEHVIQMTPNPDYALEHRECVAEARKILDNRF